MNNPLKNFIHRKWFFPIFILIHLILSYNVYRAFNEYVYTLQEFPDFNITTDLKMTNAYFIYGLTAINLLLALIPKRKIYVRYIDIVFYLVIASIFSVISFHRNFLVDNLDYLLSSSKYFENPAIHSWAFSLLILTIWYVENPVPDPKHSENTSESTN